MAQIKHLLPEAIEIKRVLIHDESTRCMKPDLHVTLNAYAVEDHDKSKKISLRKVFRTRLADFFKAHPQVYDDKMHTCNDFVSYIHVLMEFFYVV